MHGVRDIGGWGQLADGWKSGGGTPTRDVTRVGVKSEVDGVGKKIGGKGGGWLCDVKIPRPTEPIERTGHPE
jgi:hypothetical protein